MLNPKGFLFDLDGTLVDTSRDITANINRAFDSMGYTQLPHETILSHVGFGAHFLVQKCLKIYYPEVNVDDKLVTEVWERFRDFYRDHIVDEAEPYAGVVEFLNQTSEPMAVISNKPEEMVIAVLRELGLQHHFKFCWGRDTLPVSKPDPEIIRYGIHELGMEIPGEICMVGDNPVDIIAAKGAGAISVGLASGFSPGEVLEKESPEFLFTSFLDFSKAVQDSRST